MLASSSPPKLSRLRQGPRSRATIRRPRSVSTLAAVAPQAPAPMMQTSARSGLVLGATVILPSRGVVALGEPGQGAVAPRVHLGQGLRPWEPDPLPADPIQVAAIS